MRERLGVLGGRAAVESSRGRGTRVRLEMPDVVVTTTAKAEAVESSEEAHEIVPAVGAPLAS
jgi:signal transduction histidine kinase